MKIEKTSILNGVTMYRANGDIVGQFSAVVTGDGNSTTYEIICKGDQFDLDGPPLVFTVMGEWEMSDLANFLQAISPKCTNVIIQP